MNSGKRLNVLQICHDYEGPFPSICRQYAAAFPGDRVTTLYLRGAKSAEVEKSTGGDRVLFLEEKPLRGIKLSTILRVARLFRKETFDVVIAHRYKPIYIAGVMSRFFPIRALFGVAHEHGVFRRISRSLLLTLWCRDMQVVAVSDTVRNDVLKYAPSLGPAARVFTLHHGIDLSREQSMLDREEARDALGVPRDAFCFGTVGRLVDKKDQQVLLEACRHPALADACVAVTGAGYKEAELKQYVARHGLGDRVIFTGWVRQAWRYLRAFDVFVLTSGAREAFGMVLLEAMLARLPVICSDAPGPAEVVGDAGILFATGDARDLAAKMNLVLAMDNDARECLASKGYERLKEKFSMDAFRERFWSLPPLRDFADEREP